MPILLLVSTLLAATLQSSLYPITVEADDETLGQEGLTLAEEAWAAQVEGMGFAPPLMVDADGNVVDGFSMRVSDMGEGVLATFNVGKDDPSTSRSDCAVTSLVNSAYLDHEGWYGMCVAHLLNHASLHAIDCLEPQMPAFDLISVAIEQETGQAAYWPYYVETFQSMPWESLDQVFYSSQTAYYQFGSSLFTLYLDEAYGDADGRAIAALWEGTAQDGQVTRGMGEMAYGNVDNEPDFLDAMDAWLQGQGSSLDEAWGGFTEWRWFTGANDDGAHFLDGAAWEGSEVAVDTEVDTLPVTAGTNVEPMAEYSSSYVVFHVEAAAGQVLRLTFTGEDVLAWSTRALVLPEGGTPQVVPFTDTVDIPLDALTGRVVLAVAALSDGVHDPEDADWDTDATYTYDAEVTAAPVEETAPEGCGCASSARGTGLGSLFLGALLLGRRRRPSRA